MGAGAAVAPPAAAADAAQGWLDIRLLVRLVFFVFILTHDSGSSQALLMTGAAVVLYLYVQQPWAQGRAGAAVTVYPCMRSRVRDSRCVVCDCVCVHVTVPWWWWCAG